MMEGRKQQFDQPIFANPTLRSFWRSNVELRRAGFSEGWGFSIILMFMRCKNKYRAEISCRKSQKYMPLNNYPSDGKAI